jgi:hypothetical protein
MSTCLIFQPTAVVACVMCVFTCLLSKKHHPCMRRELPCSMHTPANQTSRIEHDTHASKPLPTSSQKWAYVVHGVICSLVRALEQCPSSVALRTTCVVQTISGEFMGLIRQKSIHNTYFNLRSNHIGYRLTT